MIRFFAKGFFYLYMSLLLGVSAFAKTKPAILTPFNPKQCENRKFEQTPNSNLAHTAYSKSWITVTENSENTQTDSSYKCANSKLKSFTFYNSSNQYEGTYVKEIRCKASLIIESSSGPSGEGHSNDYVNLRTCENLGFGDIDSTSPDGRFLILTANADVEAGYDSPFGTLTALECTEGACKRIFKKQFKNKGFSELGWNDKSTLEFRRTDLLAELNPKSKNKPEKCVVNFEKTPTVICK